MGPDNLLAFLALLGLLRALETARPLWRPRVRWSLDEPPLRAVLVLSLPTDPEGVCAATAEGLGVLTQAHEFAGRKDLSHSVKEAREALEHGRSLGGYGGDLISALFSDAAVKMLQGKPQDIVEATPLCLLFGQGHQHFLERLAITPKQAVPPPRGRGRKQVRITEAQCLAEALFSDWARPDPTFSFRWDPAEDVRYALMFGDPSNAANKEGTQHGANRLAAVGFATVTAIPAQRGGEVRLQTPGGAWDRGFGFCWPIWRDAISLDAIRGLLVHPDLRRPHEMRRLGVDHVREARRISVGKFMNFTPARVLDVEGVALAS